MTKKHFIRAAEIVRAIANGDWTNQPPYWATSGVVSDYVHISNDARAVQTAEAFITLAREFNPRFDTQRFLIACGLMDAPVKAKGKR